MVKNILGKTAITLLIIIIWVLVFLFGTASIIFKGPSPSARDLLVTTVMETSAAKFVARMYFSETEINKILAGNTVDISNEEIDQSLVVTDQQKDSGFDKSAVKVHEITGSTYRGKMLVVNDPSRIYVGGPLTFGAESGGLRVEDMVKRDGAIAGVNGGGFEDINGVGNGGKPIGPVIQGGAITYGTRESKGTIVGFDKENKLVIGYMAAGQAIDRGVRDAVSFDPVGALIINGEPLNIKGSGGGLNPRTAIGQRADGSVLILVVDGRQSHSIGASYKDLIDVMLEWEAINAANLDGGSSSLMVYEDKIITVCASLYGSRKIPTAILVK